MCWQSVRRAIIGAWCAGGFVLGVLAPVMAAGAIPVQEELVRAVVLPAQTPQPECSVETVDSPVVLDGAARLLAIGNADGVTEVIWAHAYHLTSGNAAAALVQAWLETLPREIAASPHPFSKLLAGAANVEATATFSSTKPAVEGLPDDALHGAFHLTAPDGTTRTVPFALLAVQDGERAFLVIVSHIPDEGGRDGATPTARATTPTEHALKLVLEMMTRPLGSAVMWALPCEGGMAEVLPAEEDFPDAMTIANQQYVSTYGE